MAGVGRPAARSPTATSRSTASTIQGVSVGVRQLLDVRRRARPPDEPDRSRDGRARSPSSAGRSPTGCSARVDPLDKMIQIEGSTSGSSASAPKRGSLPRPVAGRVRRHPARPVPDDVRRRAGSCRSTVKPRDLAQHPRGHGRGDGGAAHARGGSSRGSRTTSGCSPPTRSSTSTTRRPTASSPCWSASSRCRSSSAASSS